jgi:trans-aconitate 2-methyltransferase
MSQWNPGDYLRFGDERTRPSVDLVSRIALDSPADVIDLGCGPGNSTSVLAQRWPDARVVGLDSSQEMIDAARCDHPEGEWVLSPIESWTPDSSFDLVFSNAALQWLPDHGPLVERLFAHVASAGALAFQIPSVDYAHIGELIKEVARQGAWAPRMQAPLDAIVIETPDFYYDHLAPLARSVDMWETVYYHVMDSAEAIVEWIASTGLRPYLGVLDSDDERELFLARLLKRVGESYAVRADGRVLFPFRRTFVIAYA